MEKQKQLQKLKDNLLELKKILSELNSDNKTIVSIHYNLLADVELQVLMWDVGELKELSNNQISSVEHHNDRDVVTANLEGVKFISVA